MKGVRCPLKSEQNWLNDFLLEYGKNYPGKISILESGTDSSFRRKTSGIIVNDRGEGIGMVSWEGKIERFPRNLPMNLVKILEETKMAPTIRSLIPGDSEQLARQVEKGYLLKHTEKSPTGEETKIEEIEPVSKKSAEEILEKISEGIEEKRYSLKPKEEISSLPTKREGLLESIRRKSAMLSSPSREICPEGFYKKDNECVAFESGKEARLMSSIKEALGKEKLGLRPTQRETEESCRDQGLYWSQNLGKCVILSEREKFLRLLEKAAQTKELKRTGECQEGEIWDPRMRSCTKL